MKKSTHKRLTAWLLTLALVVTLLPGMGMTALAVEDGGEGNGPPAVEVVAPEDESSGSDETVGTPPSTESEPPALPESKEEDKTTEDEGGSSGSDYDIGDDTRPQGSMRMPVMPTAAGQYPAASEVLVDGNKYFGEPGCYYFKNGASACSKDPNNYNAYYNPNTGVLTLDGYNGGSIVAGGTKSKITVELVGNNSINGSLTSAGGGNITVTSGSGGTLSISKTTSGSNPAIGIETGLSASDTTGNVMIKGNAKVTINMTHNGTSTYEKAYGIFAKENITISENASVDITCATPNNTTGGGNCNGLYAAKDVTIDTNGTIKIDVTNAGRDKDNGYSYGVYHMRTATLTKVGNMEVQWKKEGNSTRYSGGAFTKGATFSDTDHAINEDTTNCYASYRYGTPRTVTVQNGTVTGPGVPNASGSGMFLENDTVNITPYERKGKSGETIPFKGWTSSDVTLTSPTTASNSFTVPGKDVTVTAMHNPFDGAPVFTRTSDSSGTIAFKTAVKPDNSEFFEYVKDGETTYNGLYPQPTTTSSASPYEYSVSASTYYVGDIKYLEAGDYRMAVTLNGERYLSDPFTVNYVKPRPEISVSYWPDPTVFTSVEVGYDFATGRTLTIDNKGTADTGPLTITVEGANPEAFTVSPSTISNIAAGKSAMSTVRPATGLPAGTYTATLTISGANVDTLSRNMEFTVKDPNASATVSGTVTSYGDAGENVTVTLTKQDETTLAFTDTLTGAAGTAPYSQNYSFLAVPAGTYTLKVEKKGHAPWTESITVDSAAIAKDVTVYLWGDVNRDGDVTAADAQEIQRKAAGLSSVFDTDPNSAYCTLRADVNKDEKVTAADAQEIQRKAAGLSSTISTLP